MHRETAVNCEHPRNSGTCRLEYLQDWQVVLVQASRQPLQCDEGESDEGESDTAPGGRCVLFSMKFRAKAAGIFVCFVTAPLASPSVADPGAVGGGALACPPPLQASGLINSYHR